MEKMPIIHSIQSDGIRLPEARSENSKIDAEKLKKACGEFESLFLQEIMKFMRRIIPASGSGFLGSGKDIYQSLFDQELSRGLAKRGGLRIGEMVYKQMMRHEEKKASLPGTLRASFRKGLGSEEID